MELTHLNRLGLVQTIGQLRMIISDHLESRSRVPFREQRFRSLRTLTRERARGRGLFADHGAKTVSVRDR